MEKAAPDDFKCIQCGTCCRWEGDVRLRKGEDEKIAAHLRMDVKDFIDRHTVITWDRRGLSLKEASDGSCSFFDHNTSSCSINEVKPRQCVEFPFKWSFPGWESHCGAMKEREERSPSA